MTIRTKITGAGMAFVLNAGLAMAQTPVATEVGQNGASTVTLHLQPFLSQEELATLRVVATDSSALSLFVPSGTGFAAMAASPDDGFVRDGAAVKSAQALADFPDAAAAAVAAIAACDALRVGSQACVLVLDVAPTP